MDLFLYYGFIFVFLQVLYIYCGDIIPTTTQGDTNMYAHTLQIKHHHGRV